MRLIFDGYSGALLDRIVLSAPIRQPTRPRVARVDPRSEDRAPGPRIVPRPPERPASLKPPGQASAPAQTIAPLPAAPVRPVTPPVERPPAAASAPATTVPASPVAPPAPTPGEADPTGAPKPVLVNPQDAPQEGKGPGEAVPKPPLAAATEPVITVAPVELPPVQIEDMTTAQPRPETPAVPVMPLE